MMVFLSGLAALGVLAGLQQVSTLKPVSFDPGAKLAPNKYNPLNDSVEILATKDEALDSKVRRVAYSRIGAMEKPLGSNGGPEVDKYLKRCGLKSGYLWCAAFVADTILTASGKSKWLPTASCYDMFKWAKKQQLLLAKPQGTCVVLYPHPKRVYGHTGIVVDFNKKTGMITTIEGNSNNNGSNNGVGVYKLHRKVKSGWVFVQIV